MLCGTMMWFAVDSVADSDGRRYALASNTYECDDGIRRSYTIIY
jgi:hypothetical protein